MVMGIEVVRADCRDARTLGQRSEIGHPKFPGRKHYAPTPAQTRLATTGLGFTLAGAFHMAAMPTNRPDSENPIPEASPGDEWDVTDECQPDVAAFIAPLPRKRRQLEGASAGEHVGVGTSGLKIAPNPSQVDPYRTPRRIAIHEINGSVTRLQDENADQLRAGGKIIFREPEAHAEHKQFQSGVGRDREDAGKNPARWVLKAGAVVAAAVIFPMALLLTFNAMDAPAKVPVKGMSNVVIREAEKIEGIEDLGRISMKRNEAIQIYQAYARANRSDDIIPLLRHGASLRETLRSAWQPLDIAKGWEPDSHTDWAVSEEFGKTCALLQGRLPDHSRYTAYFTNEDNRLALDWKATAAYGTASFKELEVNSGNPEEIRGRISIVEFYTAAWPETDYQSYRFVSPDGGKSIWCYARKGETSGASIAELIPKGGILKATRTNLKITLRLARGSAGSLPNQWLIKEVIHFGWLAP